MNIPLRAQTAHTQKVFSTHQKYGIHIVFLKEWKPKELVHTIKYSNEILRINCNQALAY